MFLVFFGYTDHNFLYYKPLKPYEIYTVDYIKNNGEIIEEVAQKEQGKLSVHYTSKYYQDGYCKVVVYVKKKNKSGNIEAINNLTLEIGCLESLILYLENPNTNVDNINEEKKKETVENIEKIDRLKRLIGSYEESHEIQCIIKIIKTLKYTEGLSTEFVKLYDIYCQKTKGVILYQDENEEDDMNDEQNQNEDDMNDEQHQKEGIQEN